MIAKLKDVSTHFGLGELSKSSKLEGGKVNVSYAIRTNKGHYVVQRLGSVIPAEATTRFAEVQTYLRTNNVPVPVLLTDSTGSHFWETDDGHWRVFEYIPSTEITDKEQAIVSTAKTLADFHKVLAKHSYASLIPHFHETPHYRSRLELFTDSPKQKKVEREFSSFLNMNVSMPDGPIVTLHGDPKLANFLYDKNTVRAVLDFDTIMTDNVYIDIGDAFRSWCRTPSQGFDTNIFLKAVEAYNSHSEFQITVDNALRATRVLTAELGMRYLTDYFEESYFEWDKSKFSSAAEHNLERAREMLTYYENIRL